MYCVWPTEFNKIKNLFFSVQTLGDFMVKFGILVFTKHGNN